MIKYFWQTFDFLQRFSENISSIFIRKIKHIFFSFSLATSFLKPSPPDVDDDDDDDANCLFKLAFDPWTSCEEEKIASHFWLIMVKANTIKMKEVCLNY